MDAKVLTTQARERGVTLIEILVAMVILTVVLLGMASFAANFTKTSRQSDARTIAVTLCDQRLSEIRSSPNYAGLIANYALTENTITGFPGYTRLTQIVHTGGARPTYQQDYQTVTVTVTAPGIPTPIKKTIVVAAP